MVGLYSNEVVLSLWPNQIKSNQSTRGQYLEVKSGEVEVGEFNGKQKWMSNRRKTRRRKSLIGLCAPFVFDNLHVTRVEGSLESNPAN